ALRGLRTDAQRELLARWEHSCLWTERLSLDPPALPWFGRAADFSVERRQRQPRATLGHNQSVPASLDAFSPGWKTADCHGCRRDALFQQHRFEYTQVCRQC